MPNVRRTLCGSVDSHAGVKLRKLAEHNLRNLEQIKYKLYEFWNKFNPFLVLFIEESSVCPASRWNLAAGSRSGLFLAWKV